MIFSTVVSIVIGYLLGSVPFAYIAARLRKGVDIREVGGGNVGALNTFREVGPIYGLAVLFADVAKGALAVLIARWLGVSPAGIFAAGFTAVVGHNWPVFLGFRGGKGAATIMGALAPLFPVEFAISVGVVLVLIVITSNVRLSLAALAFIPLVGWLFDKPISYIVYSLVLLLFLVVRTLAGLRKEMTRDGGKKNLIIDRDYHFWQAKKTR